MLELAIITFMFTAVCIWIVYKYCPQIKTWYTYYAIFIDILFLIVVRMIGCL